MKLTLGEKIKELRIRDDRKQEDLAIALGVTNQAVSRWEKNGSYPDVEMLPAIANYFHVSIDELFGYHSDREERIQNILDQASKVLTNQGKIMHIGHASLPLEIEDCVNMLRAASEEFPNEPKILLKLALALNMWGWNKFGAKVSLDDVSGVIKEDAQYNSKNIFWQEALGVYEKVLKSNPSAQDRTTAIYQLTVLYCRMGKYEKAKALANQQNSLIICKELLLPLATVGEEQAQYQGEEIMVLLSWLDFAISKAISLRPQLKQTNYAKQLLLSLVHLYETLFTDGKCGKYHWNIGYLYLTLSHRAISKENDMEDALFYFEKGFDHCKMYEQISAQKDYQYTAPLVANLNLKKEEIPPMGEDFFIKELKTYPESFRNELKKYSKYAECFNI